MSRQVLTVEKRLQLQQIHVQWRDIKLSLWPLHVVAHRTQVNGRNWLFTEVFVLKLRVKPAWNFVAADDSVIFTRQLQYRHMRLELIAISKEAAQQRSNSSCILHENRGPINTGHKNAIVEVVDTSNTHIDAMACQRRQVALCLL